MNGDTKTKANRRSIFGMRSDLGIILVTSLALFLGYQKNFKGIQWPDVKLDMGMVPIVIGGSTFPSYPGLQPDYRFWKDIYTRYSTDQVILHDGMDLSIVYEVVHLNNSLGTGHHTNRPKIEAARRKYNGILERLIVDPQSRNPEARRVARLFGRNADAQIYRRAQTRIRYQPGQKELFHEGIRRSSPYLKQVKAILAAHKLPEDLAYLPHVRSAFDFHARTGSHTAGIWQLSRARCANHLEIGTAVDQRRDPLAATRVAAGILKENYKRLESWPLAITAFCGYGASGLKRLVGNLPEEEGQLRRISRQGSLGIAQRYAYSMFLAAREAARNHHIYYPYRRGIKPIQTAQVKVAGFARIDDLAAHYGVDMDTIARLNPALCEAVFMGCQLVPKGYKLNLPLRKGVNIAMLASGFPRDKYRRNQQSAAFYRVRKGDTAGKISVKFGIPLSSLISVNSLDAKATIYVDQKLILPFAAQATNLQGNRIRPIWMASKGR